MDAWTEEQEQQQGVRVSHRVGDSSEERVLRREQKQRSTTYLLVLANLFTPTLSLFLSPSPCP